MVVTIENLLSADELVTARAWLAQSQWLEGGLTAGAQAAQVKRNQQLADDAPQLPALRQLVLNALHRSPEFFSAALPLKVLPPFFNRYAGQKNSYGFHVDGAMRQIPGQAGTYLRADVSATLFLSDPDDYEGGELTIDDTFGQHGFKLPAGSLLVYPSSSLHAVAPVTRGERLASFMFIQSMVRDAQQRRLLYEMDMALLQLRAEHGESDPVVRLTGTYHNLLRQWGEP